MTKTTILKNKQQAIVVAGGIILFTALYLFGKTVSSTQKNAEQQKNAAGAVSFSQILADYKNQLQPQHLSRLAVLENTASKLHSKEDKVHAYHSLAGYWKDSLHAFVPYAWYTAEAAKLENSEKSLTFAAHLLGNRLIDEANPQLQNWMAATAKVLFERALELNPANDSSKIGLGACYIFGNISNNPMEGILPVREISEANPGNMYAQKILALGGLKSGQLDKAIERFNLILKKEPDNLEIIFRTAEAYERKGEKAKAIALYERALKQIQQPEFRHEVEYRIKELKK